MSEVVVEERTREKLALSLPLMGLFVFWLVAIVGSYLQLFADYPQIKVANYDSQLVFKPITYALLLGLAVFGTCAVESRRMVLRSESTRLTKAAASLSLVFIIAGLVTGAIMGIAWFVGNFWYGSSHSSNVELMRLLNVYLPIILDAGLLIMFVLRAFVFTGADDDDDDGEEAQVPVKAAA